MEGYRQRLQASLETEHQGLEAQVRAGLRCFFEEMENPDFARITHSEILGVSPRVDDLYRRSITDIAEMIIGCLNHAGRSATRCDSPRTALIGAALAGSVILAGTVWVRSGYEVPRDEVVEITLKVIMGMAVQL